MRGIELRQLRYFSILADELHFGRAAQLAFITQPALSQQIAKLEDSVGTRLLIRDRRGISLTVAGTALQKGLKKVFEELDGSLRRAREAAENREFRVSIGLVEYTNLPFVPPALMRLQALYPDLKVERHELNGAQQIDALRRRQIDVGFGVPHGPLPDPDELYAPTLLASGWTLLVRKGHSIARIPRLRVDDLAGERIIIFSRSVNPPLYDRVVACCFEAGFTPNFVYETMQTQTAIALVEQGLGVMLAAAYVLSSPPDSLICKSIDGFDPLNVHLFSRSDESSSLVLDLRELVIEEARRTQLRLDAA